MNERPDIDSIRDNLRNFAYGPGAPAVETLLAYIERLEGAQKPSVELVESALKACGLSHMLCRTVAERLVARGDDLNLVAVREAEITRLTAELRAQTARANEAEVGREADRHKLEMRKLELGHVGVVLSRWFGDLHSTRGLTNFLFVLCAFLLAVLALAV